MRYFLPRSTFAFYLIVILWVVFITDSVLAIDVCNTSMTLPETLPNINFFTVINASNGEMLPDQCGQPFEQSFDGSKCIYCFILKS